MNDRTMIAALLLAGHAGTTVLTDVPPTRLVDAACDLADLLLAEVARREFNERTIPRENTNYED